jgi:hypothetical protein
MKITESMTLHGMAGWTILPQTDSKKKHLITITRANVHDAKYFCLHYTNKYPAVLLLLTHIHTELPHF